MSEEINETNVEEIVLETTEEIEKATTGVATPEFIEETIVEEVVVEKVVNTDINNGNDTVSVSVGTSLSVFNGNCSMCGAFNCNSIVKDGKFKCTTCKSSIKA